LFQFAMPNEPLDRLPTIQWNRLTSARDMGSDNVCTISFLLHKAGINADHKWDTSHECHNDLFNCIKAAGLYDHIVLSLVCLNSPTSPWHDDMRW
jgi:hypothetical protein